ncbi:hypothetical protein F383_27030 [Gossypium arboreum]|uniref:Uncharacterized protein n=1 Tax=Gossypium arboreum TaxID=29729 RepID=A0A0B0MMW8_GOSAR|nr:hypothetical protein F383_27030 [Gossypium arboreum]
MDLARTGNPIRVRV